MTFIPSLTFTDYEWFPWSICNGCGMPAGNAYPSGHLVLSPIVGHACALIVETRFLELAMSLLEFSPRIPLGIFLILHSTYISIHFLFNLYVHQRSILRFYSVLKETKGRDLTQSYYKSPYSNRMSNRQSDNNATKSSITQRLRTNLGRPFGVTTAT